MPGGHLSNKPVSAEEYSACNEELQLEHLLQRQLEEDVARIFDESIFSDLEVVCGKLKILTHSCILQARTDKFYHKLHTILHVNIERNTFDEIYSYISDVYTECNLQHEEKEIIAYLEHNLCVESIQDKITKSKETEESEVFLTPKCITPYVENDVQKVINSSPSTELTKEYYALVPIEGNLFDKELIEQDELSNAFHSIIKNQTEETTQVKPVQHNKPTSLSLNSSHIPKTVKHSSSCDILNKICLKENNFPKQNNFKILSELKTNQSFSASECNSSKKLYSTLVGSDKTLDPAYSPDSLITDEPSSSSDYLSAAYTCSPGVSSSGVLQVNVGNNTSRMENIYTLSDSGLDDTAILGSVSSHKDVTLTNVSLSENTLHDLIADDASISAMSIPSSLGEKSNFQRTKLSGASSEKDCNGQGSFSEMCGKSLKEEKQRQNEEIVILESSSLSSETGSWESVYPPKLIEKDLCEKFLDNERQHHLEEDNLNKPSDDQVSNNFENKSPYKSTACFIDASSLVDEEEEIIRAETVKNTEDTNVKLDILPAPSQPVPCSTVKLDISPIDWSESIDNEDSLEQADKKDPDSIQKDLSPTIFEMTPITEDSLCANAFDAVQSELVMEAEESNNYTSDKEGSLRTSVVFMSNTPNNSIMSVTAYKQYDSKDMESDKTLAGSESEHTSRTERKGSRSPPILSGGVSVEDHLPQIGSHESSPLPKFKLENTPIVTGAFVLSQQTEQSQCKTRTSSASAWVVDMSIDPKTDNTNPTNKSADASVNEKKNIFSMYIDLGDKTTLKDMPARLTSSINNKKNSVNESKPTLRNSKSSTERNLKDTDTSVVIFEKYESLCNDPSISISEIIAIPDKTVIPENVENSVTELKPKVTQSRGGDMSSLKTTEEETELTNEQEAKDLFVKLSDLDKPVQKSEALLSVNTREVNVRMTRSIPDWSEPAFSTNSKSIEVITSFHSENALSLNRLFPHLQNEFSRSMPGSLSSRTRSPLRLGTSSTLGDAEEQGSDMSEISSMQSSNGRSGFGNSTTDSQTSSLIENCTSRLGQDLLRMFLEEIAPDVIVEVSGKRFKAHKCILSSRCQYFAGILSGGWVESLGNVIVLPPFSYNVVYFALCHIYSGLATIPDSVSIVELATIADMLGLEGLKEAIMFTLKAKYCHHFHKPCAVCIVGVLECFPLSSVYGLDDLYHKCLKWITKNFSKVWPTKAFATLPTDLLDKCYQHHIVNLAIDNVIDTVYGCGITMSSLQNSRWSESVARMCRRLISAAAHFAAPKLVSIFQVIIALPNDAPSAAKQALDDFLSAAVEWAPPEEVCRAYGYLSTIVKEVRNQHYSKPDLISNSTGSYRSYGSNSLLYTHASSWRLQCEGALVRASPRVVSTQAFKDLPSELRKRLRELGCIKYGAHAIPVTPPVPVQEKKPRSKNTQTRISKITSSTTRSVDIAHVRASFVPYAPKPVLPLGSIDTLKSNTDLRDFRKPLTSTQPPKVRTTKAQEERAKFNKFKSAESQDRLNGKSTATRAPPFEKTKPRYLEPKGKNRQTTIINKHLPKIDSSSESSRNPSPVHARNLRSSQKTLRGTEAQTMSQDSLATSSRPRTAEPSTDSLSESQTSNKYGTYTKAKHTKGSVESIKITKYQNPTNKKTKIPVLLNQTPKAKGPETRNSRDAQKSGPLMLKNSLSNTRSSDRKVPGSLMNATKSSSAKIVPKVVRDTPPKSMTSKNQKHAHSSRQQQHEEKENPPLKEIPTMERSGTFLKDEPTFGDKTTNIDIDQ
ncbi:uncharacterized protein LOC113494042 isoform X2 [Trichoplusia ni]|nr:uncharacterized protein LOC113494042 isoform X2 [Trichoplusia ni]XP_026727970.1 uncharacterized protein LOC113494042 isoform X2 [Trichoplusia ni]XP_026727971.1 uncharacterized protein LOC113494042 isoform X2 [Trichoplusia ni]